MDPDAPTPREEPEEVADSGRGPDDGPHTALPPRVEAWRKRSAAGAILTGFALGLQQALEPNRQEPSIVVQTSGDPPRDLPVEADFEYGRPRQSVVQVRPWLLDDPTRAGTPGDPGEEAGQPQDEPERG
ncbi:MAG TPA: hypothetical protein VKU88_02625 [Acidimicrobiales bacterium]|nr:hypothetical protein [Acidimicrobiales bacterium]